jgi:uncharacterized RDD family membrane protein YckC
MQWYYSLNGQRLGPVFHEELERLIQSGTVVGDTLLWRQGMDQWKTLTDVRTRDPAMFALPPSPPPLPGEVSDDEPIIEKTRRPMRIELDEQRPAPPEVLLYAGFWRRAGAFLIDLLLWFFVWEIVSRLIGTWFFPEVVKMVEAAQATGSFMSYKPTPEEAVAVLKYVRAVMLIGVVWAIIYDSIFLLRASATPGKMLFGLRLVRANNKPLGFWRIVARCLAKGLSGIPTLGIGFLIAAIDDQKRGLHDFLCNTRVVTKRKE